MVYLSNKHLISFQNLISYWQTQQPQNSIGQMPIFLNLEKLLQIKDKSQQAQQVDNLRVEVSSKSKESQANLLFIRQLAKLEEKRVLKTKAGR
jgi:hypothetical protein